METPTNRPAAVSRSVAVFEVVRTRRTGSDYIEVLVSLPGRDGTFRRSWQLRSGCPDDEQAVDISMWVANQVTTAIIASTGIQAILRSP